jgi:putative FmdB family regulatory protein
MTAREFRCRECGYPFKTADQGWARDAALMCPACGSSDVSILVSLPRREPVRMIATEQRTGTGGGR